MPGISIFCGLLLSAIGAVGYVYGMNTGHASVTALIPAFFGIVLILLGVVSRANDGLRKHLMHAALALALLGFILTAGRLLMKVATIEMSAAVISQLSMAAVCLVFLILGIRSFAAARRERGEG